MSCVRKGGLERDLYEFTLENGVEFGAVSWPGSENRIRETRPSIEFV